MNKTVNKTIKAVIVGAALLTLPACAPLEWIKDKMGMGKTVEAPAKPAKKTTTASADTETVLLSIDGEPALTKGEYDKYLTQMMQSNPYFRSVGPDALPEDVKRKVLDRILETRLIVKKAKGLGVDGREEYKKAYDETVKLVEDSLLVQFYEKDVLDQVSVTDDEVRSEFDTNKERYVKVAGAVEVAGVRFEDKNDADTFYDKAAKAPAQFESLAKAEQKGTFKELGRVSQDPRQMAASDIPMTVRSAALTMTNIPGIQTVKDGDTRWVIKVHGKTDSEYFAFDEIKTQLEVVVRSNKFRNKLEARTRQLRDEFTVDVNEDFFKKAVPQAMMAQNGQGNVITIPVDQLPIRKIDQSAAEEAEVTTA